MERVDTAREGYSGLHPPVSLNPASSPSSGPVEPLTSLRDGPLANISVDSSRATSPAASSVQAVGSPGQRPSRGSPESLPSLPKYPGAWDSLSSSPENRKANSAYFTAAWGSPYATPSPRRPSWTLSQRTSIGLASRDTSPARGRGHTSTRGPESLRNTSASSQFPRHLYSSIGRPTTRDISGPVADPSVKQFTQDWINQYLSGQPRTERTNWLSDDEGSEAPSFITARNNFGDDPTEGWLGLDDSRDEELLRTPTAANSKANGGLDNKKRGRARHKHLSTQSTATLKQEDFWGFAFGDEPQSSTMADIKDTPAVEYEVATPVSPVEKPLPPPPSERNKDSDDKPEEAKPEPTPRPMASQTSQRQKKKVAWRGKACIISVPPNDIRGSEEGGHRLLSKADVEDRLKKWREEGYHVDGFDVFAPELDSVDSQEGGFSRLPYPDPADSKQDREAKNYSVRFPNLGEWQAYVSDLQEEKLRKLGVFLGNNEPPAAASPASMAAMNHVASFPGHIMSPPIPTSSAASNPLFGSHPFSPHFNQSTNPSTNAESMASPPPQFGAQHPYFGMDGNLVAGLPYPYQPTPPLGGSLTPQSLLNAHQAGVISPGANGLPSLNSIFSPVSPLNAEDMFGQHSMEGYGGRDSVKPSATNDSIDYGHQTRASRAATLIMDEAQTNAEHFQSSNVEIAQPTPRGHDRNLSETLQKGLDRYSEADAHLENSIQGQLERSESNLQKSRWAVPEEEAQPSPAHAQFPVQDSFSTGHHRLFGEQQPIPNNQDGDEIDTNPSLAGSPRDQKVDMSHHPWHSAEPSAGSFATGHKSRSSLSGLNVEAKEFDPTASFSSNAFTFQGDSFASNGYANGSIFSPASSVFKPSGSLGSFNVAAPAFTPFGSSNLNNENTSFVPNSSQGFTFSAASFNAGAPVFNPGASLASNASEAPDQFKSSIFGDIDFSQSSNSSKKSKAIPIVRPDDDEEDDNAEIVEPGAPGPQPRQKRARRGAGESDQDVALPTPSPLGEAAQVQAPPAPGQGQKPAEGKENTVPSEEIVDVPVKPSSPETKRPRAEDEDVTEKDTSNIVLDKDVPAVTKDDSPAASETKPEPEPPVEVTEEIIRDEPNQESKQDVKAEATEEPAAVSAEVVPAPVAETPKAEPPKREQRKSIFQAMRSFTFRPSISEFVPSNKQNNETAVEPEPKAEPPKPEPEKPKAGLFASRYAVDETEETPATTTIESKSGTQPLEAVKEDGREGDQDSVDEAELNAVMDQLNGDDPDVGIERVITPASGQVASETPETLTIQQPHLPHIIRSDAPSPSPRRNLEQLVRNAPKLGSDMDAQSQNAYSQRDLPSGAQSPVRQLLSMNEHISDWDDVISSGEDEKLVQRSKFFDRHINDLVGQVLEERLGPLENALGVIQDSVISMNSRSTSRQPLRSRSEVEHSDADDEDDEEDARPVSPVNKRDRKLEKMRGVILEALSAHGVAKSEPSLPATELSAIQESIAELKALTAKPETPNIKELIQEAFAVQAQTSAKKLTEAEEIGADSLKLQLDGLKSMLRLADERAEQEIKARRDAQEALMEVQKMLGHTESEAARYRQAAEDAESDLRQLREEKIPQFEKIQNRYEAMEKQQESWELTLSELSAKNIALEGTLDEYRVSHDHWKKKVAATEEENKELQTKTAHLSSRIEDSMRARQSLRGKFDRLQDDMVNVTRDIAREQAKARQIEEDLTAKHNALRAAYDREVKLREKLELDIDELEKSEREASKLKFIFGQSQQENHRLEELVATLRKESHEHQDTAARFEREFNEARESSRVEIQRARTSMEADLESANNQVNYVRAQLETEINRLETQLENVRLDADTTKERYELLLEEARENKALALAELGSSKDMAIEEQRKMHDRVLNDLRERHARALHNSSEDRQRIESHTSEKLTLANEKVAHLQDRVAHLEEKLEITKSAARAAAQAAQAKGVSVSPSPVQHSSSPSLSYRQDSGPEKISPQALRESILVLQDQLQQRETRIEELEQELSEVDKDAPNKIKEKDTEINWLRELLGVRVDDLQDIITTLSQPSFDQNTVRDAAIRLRANLQMQQQMKERAGVLPSLADIAASPRSLPLAAAAAWGSWRKGRESFTSEAGASHTPSKSNNTGGFLSGLLTPPNSNVRYTPKNMTAPPGMGRMGSRRTASEGRPLRGSNQSSRALSARQTDKLPVPQEQYEPPTTPPLLRRSSYDHDAEPNSYDSSALMDDGDSIIAPESPKAITEEALFATQE
ncbi:Centrosome-associated protein CEP250 [Talaromyces islandicus]|uniref:Centrosome-associated protein CEP250 n=1 Tax=Talaromyces islandicus TaxID=28573 RepID=A0A0U1LPD1_TALIS|nr:Centrosome-associated protein CEP250 [Talaromyces islandicus]